MINLNENQNYYIQRISKRYKENFERDYGSLHVHGLIYDMNITPIMKYLGLYQLTL